MILDEKKNLFNDFLSRLNDDKLKDGETFNYPGQIYELISGMDVCVSEKEAYILNSLPSAYFAHKALLAYKCREA